MDDGTCSCDPHWGGLYCDTLVSRCVHGTHVLGRESECVCDANWAGWNCAQAATCSEDTDCVDGAVCRDAHCRAKSAPS